MSYIDIVKDYAELAEKHGLPQENGGVHIGMFLAWIINHRLESDEMREEAADELAAVRNREMTGLEFLCACCDGKLSDKDLSDEGNAFAEAYYSGGNPLVGCYLDDWGKLCDDSPKSYEDSWKRYDQIAAIIDRRYHDWKNPPDVTIDTMKGASARQISPWWKFWA